MIRYEAKWDNMVKMLTFILLGVLIIPVGTMIQMAVTKGAWELWIPIVVLVAGLGGAFLYYPKGYELGNDALVIMRPVSNIDIPAGSITEVKAIDQKELGTGLRLFGSGGVFGYIGLFRYKGLGGNALFYASDKSKLVVVKTDRKTYVISPDDRKGFLAQMERMKRPAWKR